MRIALTWSGVIFLLMPAVRMRWLIAPVRSVTPSGKSTTTVEAGACRVGVLGDGFAFDVVGRARVRRAFRLVELDAYVSHFCLLFL